MRLPFRHPGNYVFTITYNFLLAMSGNHVAI